MKKTLILIALLSLAGCGQSSSDSNSSDSLALSSTGQINQELSDELAKLLGSEPSLQLQVSKNKTIVKNGLEGTLTVTHSLTQEDTSLVKERILEFDNFTRSEDSRFSQLTGTVTYRKEKSKPEDGPAEVTHSVEGLLEGLLDGESFSREFDFSYTRGGGPLNNCVHIRHGDDDDEQVERDPKRCSNAPIKPPKKRGRPDSDDS